MSYSASNASGTNQPPSNSPLATIPPSPTSSGQKDWGILALVIILTLCLPLLNLGIGELGVTLWATASANVNKHLLYQPITVLLTLLLLAVLYWVKPVTLRRYLRLGQLTAAIRPEPWLGIRPKADEHSSDEHWGHLGRNFAVIITLVTAGVIYLQLFRHATVSVAQLVTVLPLVLVFAMSNAFVEEVITRLGVIVALKDRLADGHIAVVSGLLFGSVHYWGNPKGIFGVLLAGFLGWFLAKSVLETQGMFWAWLIHGLQDVVIFSALLTQS